MDSDKNLSKYEKLAENYSKIRAQASVLKRAVLEEQNKNSCLRETLRIKEASLRRSEQEVDSLGFRNKQLEYRVASLQDDLERETKNINKNTKLIKRTHTNEKLPNDILVAEELQKKISENAQLLSLISDKNSEIQLYASRIKELEIQTSKNISEHSEIERKLRKEIESLTTKNSELEAKGLEVTSTIGSEDGLSASGSDNTPIHTHSSSSEDRIAFLEKEINHWRTQYEILKVGDTLSNERFLLINSQTSKNDENGLNKYKNLDKNDINDEVTKEQLLYDHFSKRIEELYLEKCEAESKINSYIAECESLQNNFDVMNKEILEREEAIKNYTINLQITEEDLATTRINYEEQISVLTEQVIFLSDQLAGLK